jgi:hypothetical protein
MSGSPSFYKRERDVKYYPRSYSKEVVEPAFKPRSMVSKSTLVHENTAQLGHSWASSRLSNASNKNTREGHHSSHLSPVSLSISSEKNHSQNITTSC